jgi:hypothetical protein
MSGEFNTKDEALAKYIKIQNQIVDLYAEIVMSNYTVRRLNKLEIDKIKQEINQLEAISSEIVDKTL